MVCRPYSGRTASRRVLFLSERGAKHPGRRYTRSKTVAMPWPTPDAHCGQSELGVPSEHGVDQRCGDAGTARSERMADCNRAAADVDFVWIKFQHSYAC